MPSKFVQSVNKGCWGHYCDWIPALNDPSGLNLELLTKKSIMLARVEECHIRDDDRAGATALSPTTPFNTPLKSVSTDPPILSLRELLQRSHSPSEASFFLGATPKNASSERKGSSEKEAINTAKKEQEKSLVLVAQAFQGAARGRRPRSPLHTPKQEAKVMQTLNANNFLATPESRTMRKMSSFANKAKERVIARENRSKGSKAFLIALKRRTHQLLHLWEQHASTELQEEWKERHEGGSELAIPIYTSLSKNKTYYDHAKVCPSCARVYAFFDQARKEALSQLFTSDFPRLESEAGSPEPQAKAQVKNALPRRR